MQLSPAGMNTMGRSAGSESHRRHVPEFLWCVECERAYQFGDAKQRQPDLCPYRGCTSADRDAWDWEQVRWANPHYPSTPAPGVTYPLAGGFVED